MEFNTGLKKILTHSGVYNIFGKIISKKGSEKKIVDEFILSEPVKKILDCGCGTASVIELLPSSVQYTGIDISENYISHAKNQYASKGQFYCADINNLSKLNLGHFDCIIVKGLLHHLDDAEVIRLLKSLKGHLAEGGKIFTLDNCFVENQKIISKFLIQSDRGKNVRWLEDYRSLALKVFNDVKIYHRNKYLRVPYDHAIMVIK